MAAYVQHDPKFVVQSRNDALPDDAPNYLKMFLVADWGSGHKDHPMVEIPFDQTFPTKATRAIQLMLTKPDEFLGSYLTKLSSLGRLPSL